jgi:DNA-binding CsgD family transcriptional regulator
VATNQLTHRENEVLELATLGMSNDEIAARLTISRRTVETHLRTVFQKTGVTRRSQLLALSRSEGASVDGAGPTAVLDGTSTGHRHRRSGEPSRLQRRVQLYADAVHRLVDRQFPLFEERVEITVLVGGGNGQDSVIERRWTTPRPYLAYRISRPIVASVDGGGPVDPVDPAELALACDVYGQDILADVNAMQDEDGQPMVMVMFQPGLQACTEWTLRYQSPGLWDPLRATGEDALEYATATLDRRHRPTIDELTLRVVFPPGWAGERVTERGNLGTGHTERLDTGQTRVTWQDRAPVARTYRWTLHGAPA